MLKVEQIKAKTLNECALKAEPDVGRCPLGEVAKLLKEKNLNLIAKYSTSLLIKKINNKENYVARLLIAPFCHLYKVF